MDWQEEQLTDNRRFKKLRAISFTFFTTFYLIWYGPEEFFNRKT
jgi:hypothetical protein